MQANQEQFVSALGPLAALYADPEVLEIMVDAPERVLVERSGQLLEAGVRFDSPQAVLDVIQALLALNGETAIPGQTILPLRFPGEEARGMAVLPPTALQGPCLTIRKPMNTGWISWEKLLEFGALTPDALECIQRAVLAPVNILMAGGTNSGKTTVANRIAELIPAEQRLIVVEKIHALQIRHPRAVYLEAGQQGAVSYGELIDAAAKMRPDWLAFGELSGAEAMRVVEVLGWGYSGLSTIHANSLEDALARLEAFCLTANLGLGLAEIRNQIAAAFQLVLYQKRLPDGTRKIVQISELRGVQNSQFLLEPLFRYETASQRLKASGIKPSWE